MTPSTVAPEPAFLTASTTPLHKDNSVTEEVSLPLGEPFTFSGLDLGLGSIEYFLRLKFRTTKNQVIKQVGGFLNKVSFQWSHLPEDISKCSCHKEQGCQECKISYKGQNRLCYVNSTPTDKRYMTNWPLYTASGLQKQEAIGKIIFSSLLSKPYLRNFELL